MTKSKLKNKKSGKNGGKSKGNAAGQFSEQQILNHALQVLNKVCDQLAGPGVFDDFSPICKMRLVSNRYPAVRLKAAAGCSVDPSQFKMLNEIFKSMLAQESVPGREGGQVSLSAYLREGLTMLYYTEFMEEFGVVKTERIRMGFAPWERGGEGYAEPVRKVVQLMQKFCVVMSDWSTGIVCYNLDCLCALGGGEAGNVVLISTPGQVLKFLKLDGHSRELVRAGWSGIDGKVSWLQAKPWRIGFRDAAESNVLVDVYIQRHALQRLSERLGLVPGLMHEEVFDTFRAERIFWHKRAEKRLVEFRILGKKLGYLVCSLDEGMVVIRSFLFLTNSGTPEGNRLSELTSLEPLDKQYLGIDTLLGFAGFDFGKDERLSALFREAGCGDLLEVSELLKFTKQEVKGQDADVLLRYLTGIRSEQDLRISGAAGEVTSSLYC